MQSAVNAGSLVVASAGNDQSSAPRYPAAYPEALSVSALAPDGSLATYSSYGPTVDIAAPGGQVSLGSDYGVQSLNWHFQLAQPASASWQGTSMAAPHVSGVAALVLAASPGLTAAQLRARLVDHAIDLGPTGPDDSFGAGLVNANASVRNGVGAPRSTYVRVVHASSGASFGPVSATAGGGYSVNALPDGQYRVYVGQDRNGDGLTGFFDRRWGALGGSTTPGVITITQSSIESASFSYGYPIESESNDGLGTADPLPVGGYAYGSIASGADVDVYRFEMPEPGTVILETDGFIGACGFAGEADTVVRLLDADGAELDVNDDIEPGVRRCSRLSADLPAGSYYAEVTGWNSTIGYYQIRIAEGG